MITNQLAHEKSPYLLQHKLNPVNWYPWGKEALEKARTENKPIFLSIGYSTCHWCHVMARESFENKGIADLLNKSYISIKVDREERPDIDSVYMSVCQAMTGQGGWPLTIIMTPECKPFFAATYLPPRSRFGMYGLDELLDSVAMQWKNEKEKLINTGNSIQSFLEEQCRGGNSEAEPTKQLLKLAFQQFEQSFDSKNGGFGPAPKFPTPHNLLFLMGYAKREGNQVAMDMAEKTLIQMYRGGIFDHIGGGFSRYSTDEKWLTPHFEKMLYDNALLSMAYLEAYDCTENPLYLSVAERTLDYVLKELTDAEGGFYCGQDADSEGIEGKYYVFTPEELTELLGKEDAKYFCEWFDITEKGNFEGKNILNLLNNDDYEKREERICRLSQQLYEIRPKRAKLHKDDKILLSWNGLMIAALAKAYAVTDKKKYRDAAQKAEKFIEEKLIKNKRLMVRYRDQEAVGEGKIDDYAFYIFALLEMYRVTFEIRYLTQAVDYAEIMMEQFFDEIHGGFYFYAKDGESLIVRPKELYDGAIPSGNSVAAYVLERLFKLTGEIKWQISFEKQIRFLTGSVKAYPPGYSFVLLTLLSIFYSSKELICLSPFQQDMDELRHMGEVDSGLIVLVKTKENREALDRIAPFTKDYKIPEAGCRFYFCSGNGCSSPVNNLDTLKRIIYK